MLVLSVTAVQPMVRLRDERGGPEQRTGSHSSEPRFWGSVGEVSSYFFTGFSQAAT